MFLQLALLLLLLLLLSSENFGSLPPYEFMAGIGPARKPEQGHWGNLTN
jgi:hypothetical protein